MRYKAERQESIGVLQTAGEAYQIKLAHDRSVIPADGQDLCYIEVELLDTFGIKKPTLEQLVEFEIEGPALILAVISSSPMSN